MRLISRLAWPASLRQRCKSFRSAIFRQFARRGREKNIEYRTREHLTEAEVERLIHATSSHRDATMILLAFRHGLRAAELVDLRWEQIDFQMGVLHVRRAKAGTPATHPLTGRELRALRRLQRETGPATHLFISQRKAPISIDGYQKMIERLSVRAKLGFQVHAHMLRHACGLRHRHPHRPSLPRAGGVDSGAIVSVPFEDAPNIPSYASLRF